MVHRFCHATVAGTARGCPMLVRSCQPYKCSTPCFLLMMFFICSLFNSCKFWSDTKVTLLYVCLIWSMHVCVGVFLVSWRLRFVRNLWEPFGPFICKFRMTQANPHEAGELLCWSMLNSDQRFQKRMIYLHTRKVKHCKLTHNYAWLRHTMHMLNQTIQKPWQKVTTISNISVKSWEVTCVLKNHISTLHEQQGTCVKYANVTS